MKKTIPAFAAAAILLTGSFLRAPELDATAMKHLAMCGRAPASAQSPYAKYNHLFTVTDGLVMDHRQVILDFRSVKDCTDSGYAEDTCAASRNVAIDLDRECLRDPRPMSGWEAVRWQGEMKFDVGQGRDGNWKISPLFDSADGIVERPDGKQATLMPLPRVAH